MIQKNYLCLSILFIAALILTSIQTSEAFATQTSSSVTAKATVVITPVPSLCRGHIDHFDHFFFGTKDNQRLVGTNQNDLIVGFENTLIYGRSGDDCLVGGNGNNFIDGNPGNDVIMGGSGTNIIFTGNGNNIVHGGPSNNIIFFGHGHNTIDGGAGTNYCIGDPSNSIIVNCIIISHSHGMHGIHDSKKLFDTLSDFQFSSSNNHNHKLPSWIINDLNWWDEGRISDDDIGSGIQYLLESL